MYVFFCFPLGITTDWRLPCCVFVQACKSMRVWILFLQKIPSLTDAVRQRRDKFQVDFSLLGICLGTTYTSPLVSSLRNFLSFPNSGKTRAQNLILEDFQLRLYTDALFQMNLVFLSWLDSLSGPSPPLWGSAFTLGGTLDEWSDRRRDTTLTRDRHPCCRRDSNLRSQQDYTHTLDAAVDWK